MAGFLNTRGAGIMGARLVKSTLLLLTLLWGVGANAHEIQPAVADVTVGETEVGIVISLTLEPLIAGMDLSGLDDTNNSPLSGRYDALRAAPPEELEAQFRSAWPDIARGITLTAGEAALTPDITALQVPETDDVAFPRSATLTLSAALPNDGSSVVFGWVADYGPLVVRHAEAGDNAYAALLPEGGASAPLPRTGTVAQSGVSVFLNYIAVGFDHIVPKGLDHILFVLGLFFFSARMGPLLWQVTAFTVAHTISLALATLEIVSVPASIVEPLIALSIVYVAVENVIGGEHTGRRTALVFCFGLLHGLGFASVLGEFGLASHFIASLIGFNIGVELGQLAVIAAAFVLVGLWFHRRAWYRPMIAVPVSVVIGAVGLYWSVERIIG